MMKELQPVYFALDFETGEEALGFLERHQLTGIPVKVGMELYYREGASIIERLKQNGHNIFLDLKLHDIPETVRRAMRNLASLGVDVVNVHAQGGSRMMTSAKHGLQEGAAGHTPILLGVTMLTSTDQSMMEQELLYDRKLHDVVLHYAQLAEKSGVDGVVCSVEEAELIHRHTKLSALTPGIRLPGGNAHDQKRIATPEIAGQKGSNSIVVGRAIRDAENPFATYQQIKEAFTYGQSTAHS